MCTGIIAKDVVEAIIEDMAIPATITATETMLSPTTIQLTEVRGLGTEARKARVSIQVAVGPAEVAGTEQVTGRGIDHIKKGRSRVKCKDKHNLLFLH
jgi:hypothetical protein